MKKKILSCIPVLRSKYNVHKLRPLSTYIYTSWTPNFIIPKPSGGVTLSLHCTHRTENGGSCEMIYLFAQTFHLLRNKREFSGDELWLKSIQRCFGGTIEVMTICIFPLISTKYLNWRLWRNLYHYGHTLNFEKYSLWRFNSIVHFINIPVETRLWTQSNLYFTPRCKLFQIPKKKIIRFLVERKRR